MIGLLHDLEAEALIVVDGALPETAGAGDRDLAKPDLRKYTDMEDFMLVDPVHDVDATGWPNRAAPAAP